MSAESIGLYALLFGFLWLMSWRREVEIDVNGSPVALYRGPRFASPVFVGFYAYMIYDSFVIQSYGVYVEAVIAVVMLGILFIGAPLYFIKRRIYISGEYLVGEFPLKKPKKLNLSERFEMERSEAWGGMIVRAGSSRIVIENLLSGSEGLVSEIAKRRL